MSEQCYFLVDRVKGSPVGNPHFIDYELDKDSCGENESDGKSHFYFTSCEKQPLIFVCTGLPVADFDMYPAGGGEYFLSSRFLEVARNLKMARNKTIDVSLVSRKRENVARCDYQILRLFDEQDVVDEVKSVIQTSEKFSFYKVTKHLALDEVRIGDLDLFRIASMTFGSYIFCSSSFKVRAEKAGLHLVFVPVVNAAEQYPDRLR